jgi:hypothetical protein
MIHVHTNNPLQAMVSSNHIFECAMADQSEFDALLAGIKNGGDLDALVDGLSDESVLEIRKKLNPYGVQSAAAASDRVAVVSITNLAEKYMQRMQMTGLVSFLFRMLDEWMMADGEPLIHLDNFEAYQAKASEVAADAAIAQAWIAATPEPREATREPDGSITAEEAEVHHAHHAWKATRLLHDRTLERHKGYQYRIVARKFLDTLFTYNPDQHVRSSYASNPLDTERAPIAGVSKRGPRGGGRRGGRGGRGRGAKNASQATRHIPPADTYSRLTTYITRNYEEIRTAVTDMYAEKPDIEFAVMPRGIFTEQEAKDYVRKHRDETTADLLTLTVGKWNLVGPFKNNQERINFYNDKTEVIETILRTGEDDKKIGADLMRKRVQRKKKENIREAGPDDEEFLNRYRGNLENNSAEQNGAEDINRTGIKAKEEHTFAVHEECPYDAVQVDVFNLEAGGASVVKSEFFVQAEAPTLPTALDEKRDD